VRARRIQRHRHLRRDLHVRAFDDVEESRGAGFERRERAAAIATDALRKRADVERGDGRATEPRFRHRESVRLRHDRRQHDPTNAMTFEKRRQRASAVVAVHDDVRDLAQFANEIVIAGAAEDVQRFDGARDLRQEVRAFVSMNRAGVRDRVTLAFDVRCCVQSGLDDFPAAECEFFAQKVGRKDHFGHGVEEVAAFEQREIVNADDDRDAFVTQTQHVVDRQPARSFDVNRVRFAEGSGERDCAHLFLLAKARHQLNGDAAGSRREATESDVEDRSVRAREKQRVRKALRDPLAGSRPRGGESFAANHFRDDHRSSTDR